MTTAKTGLVSPRNFASPPMRRLMTPRGLMRTTALVGTLAGLALATPLAARANPMGGSVAAGNISITQTAPNTEMVTQQGPSGVINWQSFNIANGESTIFDQTYGSRAVTLNRVTGPGGSFINGSLQANGMIFLVNPNGVVFGQGAHVNVNGLVATTANISDNDFMAGRYNFNQPSPNRAATVENQGTITIADGGLAALVAPGVANSGTITARAGRIELGGALTFGLDLYGDGLLYFDPSSTVNEVPVDSAGNKMTALVENTGKIEADGGTVALTAVAASQLLDQVINTSGVVAANSFAMKNGTVVLSGSGGAVMASGTIEATGQSAGQTGGTVKLLGDEVGVMPGAVVDASGSAGGGTVLVGGDEHGQGPDPNATATYVAPGATIKADATQSGDGGRVVVWSENYTNFEGDISAKGGPSGGNGGTVEVSSHDILDFVGNVDTLAPAGNPGTLLLDPADITIEKQADSGVTYNSSDGYFTPDDTIPESVLNVSTLERELANGDVTVSTQTSGTMDASGGITVQDAVTWSSNATLTLLGEGEIDIRAQITGSSSSSGLVMQANSVIAVSAPISAGSVSITGNAGITLAANVTTAGGGQVYNSPDSPLTLQGAVTLSDNAGGSIVFNSRIEGTTAGADSLTITAPSSSVTFDGSIGDTTPIGALTLTDTQLFLWQSIYTDSGAVTQNGATILQPTEVQGVTLNIATTSAGGGTFGTTSGANITFNGPIDDPSHAYELYLTSGTAGAITLDGNVGAQESLFALQAVGSAINLGGISVTTSGTSLTGGQGYFGPITLNGNTTLNNTGPDNGGITLSAVDSGAVPSSLTINDVAGSAVYIEGAIGASAPLSAFSVTGGNVLFQDGPSVTTVGGGQSYDGAVLLYNDVTLTNTGAGAISFGSTIDSASTDPTLTIVTGGPVTFTGAIGGASALTNLNITGSSIDFQASATVTGDISAVTVTSGTSSNGNITLASGVTLTSVGEGAIIIEAGSNHAAGDPTGGNFVNDSGANALVTTPYGGWIVYTGDPVGQGTVDGGLAYTSFVGYDTSFEPDATGNFMIFRGGALPPSPPAPPVVPIGPIDQTLQQPQPDQVAGVSFTIPFFEKRVLSSDSNTPPDPTLIYSNSGDPGLW